MDRGGQEKKLEVRALINSYNMSLRILIVLMCVSVGLMAKPDSPLPTDSTVYQFGNDTILQTLTIRWKSDSVFEYTLLSQDLRDMASMSAKGQAQRRSVKDEPMIKSGAGSEFPADFYLSPRGDCKLSFYVQYLHKEKVWVEKECKRPQMHRRISLESVGILEKVR